VPFVASRATSATNLANLFTTVERHDVGITLRMTPQITADDFVRLALFEEVSDIDPTATASVGDPTLVGPTTTIRSASTAVAARAARPAPAHGAVLAGAQVDGDGARPRGGRRARHPRRRGRARRRAPARGPHARRGARRARRDRRRDLRPRTGGGGRAPLRAR